MPGGERRSLPDTLVLRPVVQPRYAPKRIATGAGTLGTAGSKATKAGPALRPEATNSLAGCGKRVIFLSGAIGAGKSTIGRALAVELDGFHVEGDDHQQPPRLWYATSLSTCRDTLEAVIVGLSKRDLAVVSYPLRCFEWIYYRRRLAELGVASTFVTLAAGYEATVDRSRGRAFEPWEKERIREMIGQGYDRREFSDFIIRSDGKSSAATLKEVVAAVTQ